MTRKSILTALIACAMFTLSVHAHRADAFPIASSGEGLDVVVEGSPVIAIYEGNSAAYSNNLYLVTDDGIPNNDIFIFNNHNNQPGDTVNLGSFAAGTTLVFRLEVLNTGDNFFTGSPSRNPDGHAHARVETSFLPNVTLVSFEDLFNGAFDYNDLSFSFTNTVASSIAVPEPATFPIFGMGLLSVVLLRRRA